MDDIDRANDALERATERHREQLVGRALRPARVCTTAAAGATSR